MILILFSACFYDARAESMEADLSELSLEELMNVEVSSVSKYKQKINEAPASIIVISHQDIIDRAYFDLSDIMKDLPGVDMVDHARGFGEYYTPRGIEGNDRFLVLIDGQKLNPVSGTFLSIGNSISVRFAERVEIIFGPASAMYGADAFAGIINIISSNDKNNSMQTYVNYGSLNTLDFAANMKKTFSPDLSFSLAARIFKSDGPDFTDKDTLYSVIQNYVPPLRQEFEQPIDDHNLYLKINYKDIVFSWYRQQFDEGNAFGTNPNDNIYNKENRWKSITNMYWTEYKKTLPGIGQFNANLAYVSHVQDPETQFFKTFSANDFTKTYNQYLTGKDKSIRTTLNYLNDLNDLIEFIGGIEFEYTNSIPPYANDQVLGVSLKYEGSNADLIDEKLTLNEQRYASFIQFTVNRTENLHFIAGIRYDYSTRYGSTVNPRIGWIGKIGNKTSLKIINGHAFQAPSLFLQYEQWGSAGATMLSVDEIQATEPDWELQNQTIRTHEIVLNHKFNTNLNLNISSYYHSLNALIERVKYTDFAYNKYYSTDSDSIYTIGFRNENVGSQDVYGVDVILQARIDKQLSTYFQYSFINAIAETEDGNIDIPRIAPHKLWMGFVYRELFGWLTLSPEIKWVGEMNNKNSIVYPDGKQPGYTTIDLALSADNLINDMSIYVRMENCLNAQIEHGGLYNQQSYLPTIHQPGFLFRAGVDIQF